MRKRKQNDNSHSILTFQNAALDRDFYQNFEKTNNYPIELLK